MDLKIVLLFAMAAVALGADFCNSNANCTSCPVGQIAGCHGHNCHCHNEGHRCNPNHADHCSHLCSDPAQTATCDLDLDGHGHCHCDGQVPTGHHGHGHQGHGHL